MTINAITKYSTTAILTSILIFSPVVNGATYELSKEQVDYSSMTMESIIEQDNAQDSPFFNSVQDLKSGGTLNKQTYLDVVNLLKKNKLKEGEEKITALLKEMPEEANLYNLKALLHITKKETKKAIISSKKAISLDPANFAAIISLSKLYLETGELDQARQFANKAIVINRRSIFSYFVLAEVARRENNYQEVERILLIAKELSLGDFKNDIVVTINLAKLYAVQKQPQKTLSLAEKLVKSYPGNNSALAVLAEVQLVSNEKKLAEKSLKKLLALETKNIKHRLLLAKLLVVQPDKEQEVLKLLDEVTALAPEHPQVLIQKAKFLTLLKKYQQAIAVAKEVQKLAPQAVQGKILEADIYRAEKKYNNAVTGYQEAYQIKPNGRVMGAIVDVLNLQGKQAEAITFLKNELQKNDKNLAAHFKLAGSYQQRQNNNKAEKHYKVILGYQPDNAVALNNLAWLYSQQKNPKAIKLAEKAYKKMPKSALIMDTYGYILVKQGDRKKGIDLLKKAIELSPNAYDIQYHLAQAYVDNNNKIQALEILNKIVKFDRFSEKTAAIDLLIKLKMQ